MRRLALGLIALGLLPAAAHADSLVYAKRGGIWAARPDGRAPRLIARGYAHPTQADDGTILAQRGSRFVRLSRTGRVLATLDSVLTGKPSGIDAVGPFDPQISPDGTKLAYWIGMYSTWQDHGNGINWTRSGPVTVWQNARSGKLLGVTHYYSEPSWLPDSTGALLFAERNALTPMVVAARVGAPHTDVRPWFNDWDVRPAGEVQPKPIGAGELSPGVDRLAVLRGGTTSGAGGLSQGPGNTIMTYAVRLPGIPQLECRISGATGGEFGEPSWSPRGEALAWSEGDGIWTAALGHDCGGTPRLAIPGGREPDWGPADPGGRGAATARIGAARRVVTVRVHCPSGCRASIVARRSGRTVARAQRRVRGSATIRLRPRATGTLSVRVTLRPRTGRATTIERTVRVRGR
jgi:hypothetical protein